MRMKKIKKLLTPYKTHDITTILNISMIHFTTLLYAIHVGGVRAQSLRNCSNKYPSNNHYFFEPNLFYNKMTHKNLFSSLLEVFIDSVRCIDVK